MRKEEKKMARKRGEDIEDQEEYLMALGFDPKELRAKRYASRSEIYAQGKREFNPIISIALQTYQPILGMYS